MAIYFITVTAVIWHSWLPFPRYYRVIVTVPAELPSNSPRNRGNYRGYRGNYRNPHYRVNL